MPRKVEKLLRHIHMTASRMIGTTIFLAAFILVAVFMGIVAQAQTYDAGTGTNAGASGTATGTSDTGAGTDGTTSGTGTSTTPGFPDTGAGGMAL